MANNLDRPRLFFNPPCYDQDATATSGIYQKTADNQVYRLLAEKIQ
jgi:hypothetical protein